MTTQVDLLVHVNSKHSFIRITELHIYHLVATVAPVVNIHMLDEQPHYRALARVADTLTANLVVKALNGSATELGTVWVSAVELGQALLAREGGRNRGSDSAKENIKYKEPVLAQLNSTAAPWTPFGGSHQARNGSLAANTLAALTKPSQSRTDVGKAPKQQKAVEIKHGNTPLSNNINHGNTTALSSVTNTNSNTVVHLCITHDSTAQLAEKKVLKAFRRFGRVFNMSYDEKRREWTLEYSSAKEVSKVTKVLANNKLFGYRLSSVNSSIDRSTETCSPSHELKSSSKNTSAEINSSEGATVDRSSLRIDVMDGDVTLEKICSIVASVHIPVQMSFGYDPVRGIRTCVADFNFVHQAAEALVAIGQQHENLCCRITH